MARVVRLTATYRRRLLACGVTTGSALAREVGRHVRDLADARDLPDATLDAEALIPPTHRAYVRRVAGRNVWLWWRVDETELVMLLVTTSPPVPLET